MQDNKQLHDLSESEDGLDAVTLAAQTAECIQGLLDVAGLQPGEVLVLGCSTSEVCGHRIGSFSSTEAAEAMYGALCPPCRERGVYLAVQCCEHLNRALVVERQCAEAYGWTPVSVRPVPKAGGSMAATAMARFDDPVVVERVQAHAGIDVGDTLIGMHLRPVAVPVRIGRRKIGAANVVLARTRPKYIGGPRAQYD